MFRGIDPDGLIDLAMVVESQAIDVRHQSRSALDIIGRNGGDVGVIAAAMGRIDHWGTATSTNLRWRADVIRDGQNARFDILATLRAEFAATAVIETDRVDPAFQEWLADRRDSEQRITGAVADISSWLDQGWRDWDVTNSDLHNISSMLSALSGHELDRVVAELSPTQLRRWIQEMGNAINGFSREEKRQVFALLTTNTSGTAIGRVHDAILAGGGSEEAIDFGMAIRTHSSEQTIVDFVAYAVGQDLDRHKYSGVALALAARAVEDPRAIDTITLAILNAEGALAMIAVDNLVNTHIEDTGDACIEINPLESLITTISGGTDPVRKAVAFDAMARFTDDAQGQLRELLQDRYGIVDSTSTDWLGGSVEEEPATDILRGAQMQFLANATRLLVSDANGVVEELATNLDQDGALTTSFLRQLVDLERGDQLHRIVTALRGGDVVDPVRFADTGPDPDYRYPHAQNLAFLAGGLGNALEMYADDAKTRIDAISIGAGLAVAAVGPMYKGLTIGWDWAATAITTSGDATINWVVSGNVQADIDEQLERLLEVVQTRLQPTRTLDGPPVELGESALDWDYRYHMIRRLS